jgi:fluoride exporter
VSGVAWLLVCLGAGAGSAARFATDQWVQARWNHRGYLGRFPAGILLINLVGSFVLGFLAGAAAHGLGPLVLAFLATGVCGGFTTFSTWAYDTVRLAGERDRVLAAANVALTVAGGMLAAAAGLGLALL